VRSTTRKPLKSTSSAASVSGGKIGGTPRSATHAKTSFSIPALSKAKDMNQVAADYRGLKEKHGKIFWDVFGGIDNYEEFKGYFEESILYGVNGLALYKFAEFVA
jgi:hypothetical protein